ncbi:hypothetical protein SprV_0802514300 [Sparganum proliferum]
MRHTAALIRLGYFSLADQVSIRKRGTRQAVLQANAAACAQRRLPEWIHFISLRALVHEETPKVAFDPTADVSLPLL